jgi:hypothetical protein
MPRTVRKNSAIEEWKRYDYRAINFIANSPLGCWIRYRDELDMESGQPAKSENGDRSTLFYGSVRIDSARLYVLCFVSILGENLDWYPTIA